MNGAATAVWPGQPYPLGTSWDIDSHDREFMKFVCRVIHLRNKVPRIPAAVFLPGAAYQGRERQGYPVVAT
jgi:hypothetical protein